MDSSGLQNTDDCHFCEFIEVGKTTGKHIEGYKFEIFHGECLNCLSQPQDEKDLCSFCRHLRITHLAICLEAKIHIDVFFNSNFGHLYDMKCPMCRLVARAQYSVSDMAGFQDFCGPIRTGFTSLQLDMDSMKARQQPIGQLWVSKVDGKNVSQIVKIYPSDKAPQSLVGNFFDLALVVDWLKYIMDHEKSFGNKAMFPKGFQVIDVWERRIVSPQDGCRFVALSYVWGTKRDSSHLVATRESIHSMTQHGGLDASRLPATVDDAIELCNLLGERYLWVDQLCIIQDDPESKHQQISAMASIYSEAHFVMIVNDGDMHSGIPGFRQERPITQIRETVGALTLINGIPNFLHPVCRSCAWNSRAWTYQEAVLAKRRLHFSRFQAYFESREKTRKEDPTVNAKELKPSFAHLNNIGFSIWGGHLTTYSRRNLSYHLDACNAFMGICRALYPEDDAILSGLPKVEFDEALLWFCSEANQKRVTGSVPFPSWSWASVVGRVIYRWNYDAAAPLVAWSFQQANPRGETPFGWANIRDFVNAAKTPRKQSWPRPSWPSHESASFGLVLAWIEGFYGVDWPFDSLESSTFSSIESRLKEEWPTSKCLEDLLFSSSMRLPNEKQFILKDQQCVLRARAQSAHFCLRRPLSGFPKAYPGYPSSLVILDENNKYVGAVSTNEQVAKEEVLPLLEQDEKARFEFIAVSIHSGQSGAEPDVLLTRDEELLESWRSISGLVKNSKDPKTPEQRRRIWDVLGPDGLDITYFDSEDNYLKNIPLVDVILIAWRGPVAHRVSIGWIFLKRWAKANRKLKTVYLE